MLGSQWIRAEHSTLLLLSLAPRLLRAAEGLRFHPRLEHDVFLILMVHFFCKLRWLPELYVGEQGV